MGLIVCRHLPCLLRPAADDATALNRAAPFLTCVLVLILSVVNNRSPRVLGYQPPDRWRHSVQPWLCPFRSLGHGLAGIGSR